MKGKKIWEKIQKNEKLKELELAGFRRGDRKGKTMDVPLSEMFGSLSKQWKDLHDAYYLGLDTGTLMKHIANLRNVAGCLFLKIDPSEE